MIIALRLAVEIGKKEIMYILKQYNIVHDHCVATGSRDWEKGNHVYLKAVQHSS